MVKLVGKRGDTLIEVMLAVGIFSMVAVAVVAVMSSGTSSAQTALETTLAREEIDAQAEALRFIQGAYITDKNTGSAGKYTELWKEITKKAIVINGAGPTGVSEDRAGEILNYAPTSCSSLYDSEGEVQKYGFIINTKEIGNFNNYENVLRTSSLIAAVTYPHLTFLDQNGSEGNLIKGGDTFYNAQGIYIIAVRDPGTVIIGGEEEKQSAYFDFYIRTCWYGTGDQVSSNISTVIRLYDPDAIKEIVPAGEYKIYYNFPNKSENSTFFSNLEQIKLLPTSTVDRYNLTGWRCATKPDLKWDKSEEGDIIAKVDELISCASNKIVSLESIGEWSRITINYLLEDGSSSFRTTEFDEGTAIVSLTNDVPDGKAGFEFKGWNCEPNKDSGWTGSVSVDNLKNCDIDHFDDYGTVNLYAAWEDKNETPVVEKKNYTIVFNTKRYFIRAIPEVWVYKNNSTTPLKYYLSCGQMKNLQYTCTKGFSYSVGQGETIYFAINLRPSGYNSLGLTGSMSVSIKEGKRTFGYSYNSSNAGTNKWWNIFKIQNWNIINKNTYSNGTNPIISY